MLSLEELRASGVGVIELCQGTVDGRAFHAFIKMDIDNYVRYQQDRLNGGDMDLPSYGEVLHKGWGPEPDQTTKDRIMKEYGDK